MTGKAIGPYRIIERLGEGGMGEVYKAEDIRLKRLVAIKVLRRRDTGDKEQDRLRFLQEARAVSALNHPNIVQIHGLESHQGDDFIVMEYVQGETLFSLLRKRSLTVAEVLNWGGQMAAALGAAHSNGIVHRDIKPANMIVTPAGVLKVLDFGLARMERARPPSESTATAGPVTKDNAVVGTAPYMSPEQAEGKPVNARSDIFSAGAVLFEMITGRRAFSGDSMLTILSKVLRDTPPPVRILRGDVPRPLEAIVERCLSKDPAGRYESGADLARDLEGVKSGGKSEAKRSRVLPLVAAAVLAGACAFAGWAYLRNARAHWVRAEALPKIREYIANSDFVSADNLIRTALRYSPDDPDLMSHLRESVRRIRFESTPPGARVTFRAYGSTGSEWRVLGNTPVEAEIPISYLHFRVEKPGMESMDLATFSFLGQPIHLYLRAVGQVPEGMVTVPAEDAWTGPPTTMQLPEFYLDRFEVTNAKFQQFIASGGYRTREHWRHPFHKDGRDYSFQDAMRLLVDSTGRPGPSTWELGAFPKGQAEYPVSGVSWHEAAAYCESVGKSLPTEHHWRRAAVFWLHAEILTHSNFSQKGPMPVGANSGLAPFGTYDMAGNVKEWVWNEAGARRGILGGGWNEPSYMFRDPDAQDPLLRHAQFGFRCAQYPTPPPAASFAPTPGPKRDYSREKPADDKAYEIYRSMYSYDKTPLDTRVELREDVSEDWRREKVSFNTVYGERMAASLFLPKKGKPPYQVVLWAPGGYAAILASMEVGVRSEDFLYLVRTGRAVLYPVYKGTYERRATGGPAAYRDRSILQAKDTFQSVDFIESRPDLDKSRIAFYGTSLGAFIGSYALGFEPRIKAAVFLGGGFPNSMLPGEIDLLNLVPRIRLPVLMINGKDDFVYPVEHAQKPMFRLLGSPESDKRHAIFEGGHVPPLNSTMREALAWLDKYLGPVEGQP